MTNKLVYVFFENGVQAILRGSVDEVDHAITFAQKGLGEATELFHLKRLVSSEKEENSQWFDFIELASRHDEKVVTEEKYRLWRRESAKLWRNRGNELSLCILVIGEAALRTGPEAEDWGAPATYF